MDEEKELCLLVTDSGYPMLLKEEEAGDTLKDIVMFENVKWAKVYKVLEVKSFKFAGS